MKKTRNGMKAKGKKWYESETQRILMKKTRNGMEVKCKDGYKS